MSGHRHTISFSLARGLTPPVSPQVHGCVDGYSRFIVYLKAASNKRPETVNAIFCGACNDPQIGWPSRGRWDKGSENKLAMLSLIDHHYDVRTPSTLTRGSAITGRSVQNTRIEYMWRFVRQHVTGKFRLLFDTMRVCCCTQQRVPACCPGPDNIRSLSRGRANPAGRRLHVERPV